MRKELVMIAVGALLLTAGLSWGVAHEPVGIATDQELAGIRVAQAQCNLQCVVPEPDCPDHKCEVVHPFTDTTHCISKDDYWFAESNWCEPATGRSCTLQDLQNCYILVHCTKTPGLPCTTGDYACTGHTCAAPAVIQNYDDCTTQ